jgi:molecular chaperone Hsp33
MKSVSELIESGVTPEEIIQLITKGDHQLIEEMPLYYECDCSKERFENGLKSLGKAELEGFVKDGHPIEITCQFCKKNYSFSEEDLKSIIKDLD